MATALYIHQRGALRILDGTPTTPRYITIPWVQPDPAFPLNRPRPEPVLRLNREQFDAYTHFTSGPDAILAEPVEVTLSVWLDNQLKNAVLAALCNPYNLTPWSVGTSVFVTAAGPARAFSTGPVRVWPCPEIRKIPCIAACMWSFSGLGAPAGTRDFGWRHEECHFPPAAQVVRGADPVS